MGNIFNTPRTVSTWRGLESAERDLSSCAQDCSIDEQIRILKEKMKNCTNAELLGYRRAIEELERRK